MIGMVSMVMVSMVSMVMISMVSMVMISLVRIDKCGPETRNPVGVCLAISSRNLNRNTYNSST